MISVNNVNITDEAVNLESAYHTSGGIQQRQFEAARALVVREVLRQRACELKLLNALETDNEAIDIALERLIDTEVDTPEPDEAACRQYYENNPGQFTTAPVMSVRHILLAAPPDDLKARETARNHAEELIRSIKARPDRFNKLAREFSRCPSQADGGNLGQISKGQTVPEFEEALFRLDEGLASRPIKSRYGYHVVQVDRRIEGHKLDFKEAQGAIAHYLSERSRRRAINQYINVLLAEADVQGIQLDEATSPLMQ